MSGFDLHPEELLDRVRRGQASAAEHARVQEHLQHCEACRFEHSLLAQGARDATPHPGDGARARRIEQAAVAALTARGVLGPSSSVGGSAAGSSAHASSAPRSRRRVGALLAAAVVSSLATAAAAAVLEQPAWFVKLMPAALETPVPATARARRSAHARAHVAPSPPPATPPVVATPLPIAAEPPPVLAPQAERPAQTRPATTRGAAELFAAANLARREHETSTAVRLYRELARLHPRSAEAAVSRVALGRLLLDRSGDARGALREFDAYLANSQQHALREDALIGRALALGRLGRAAQEHAAWAALLAAFPGSAYAERARARLLELRCAVESC